MNAYELADDLQEFYDEFDGSFKSLEKSITMLRQQADRIAELEKLLQESAMHNISVTSQADEHYARVKELEKDLHMIQRHYDLLETFSLSGNNAEYVGNTNETLPKGSQTKPLSDEEIMDIAEQSDYSPLEIEMGYDYEIRIARAIEERHGIK